MNTIYMKIADHYVQFNSSHPDILQPCWSDYGRFLPSFPPNRIDLQIELELYDGVPTEDCHVEIYRTADSIIYQRSDYRIEAHPAYHRAKMAVLNGLAFKHALMNLYSAYIVHHGWGLLIHSSCVENNGTACLFAGPSGAGKSTVARLSSPRPLLSDEASIVKLAGGQAEVFPSPFHSELLPTYAADSCRLSAIYFLIQSLDIRTEPLKKSEVLLHLLSKVFFWHHESKETAKVMRLCKQIMEAVPAYNLHFQKNNLFWEWIS